MKKLVLGLAGLALCGIAMFMIFKWGHNVGYYEAKDEIEVCEDTAYVLDDEEIINRRIREDFDAGYYGEITNTNESGVIEFVVYDSEGTAKYNGTFERISYFSTYTPVVDNLE